MLWASIVSMGWVEARLGRLWAAAVLATLRCLTARIWFEPVVKTSRSGASCSILQFCLGFRVTVVGLLTLVGLSVGSVCLVMGPALWLKILVVKCTRTHIAVVVSMSVRMTSDMLLSSS